MASDEMVERVARAICGESDRTSLHEGWRTWVGIARAAIEAAFIWQPIKTAPAEKRVLVRVLIENHRLVIGFMNKQGLWLDERMQPMRYPPLEWMELPQ